MDEFGCCYTVLVGKGYNKFRPADDWDLTNLTSKYGRAAVVLAYIYNGNSRCNSDYTSVPLRIGE